MFKETLVSDVQRSFSLSHITFSTLSLRKTMGRDSSVGIATEYRLDGPGIKSRCRAKIFRNRPDRPWGPPSLLYNGYRVFPGGKEWPRRDADPSPTSSAVGHERVELYLYSPYGPYGLYRASVPVQGVHFTFTLRKKAVLLRPSGRLCPSFSMFITLTNFQGN